MSPMSPDTSLTLLLQPRDPVVFRDGRPFDATPGARATTLDWPWPQTLAGALRTHIGEAVGANWDSPGGPTSAHRVAIEGPLLAARPAAGGDWAVYLPAPRDALLYRPDGGSGQLRVKRLAPATIQSGEGTDLPSSALRPLDVTEAKPDTSIVFWSLADLVRWLTDLDEPYPPGDWLPRLPRETRLHVKVDARSGTAEEGELFATTGLLFQRSAGAGTGSGELQDLALLCRVRETPAGWSPTPAFIPLGGERRLTALIPASPDLWPAPPPLPPRAGRLLRLMLVTPGLFERGWLPGWLDRATLEGSPPPAPHLRLRLVSAAVGRRIPISGWRLAPHARHTRPAGPRATRHAAPAGSVYFFEALDGHVTDDQWRRLWLASISDLEWDRRNGYGLSLPGIWHENGSGD